MAISKEQSAAEHIDVAIQLFLSGKSLICALTLAGAAEDSMPKPSDTDTTLFSLMKRDGPTRFQREERDLVTSIFNKERNWLKHEKDAEPLIDITQNDALIMILRAYTKYTAVYGSERETPAMRRFESWFRITHPHWVDNQKKCNKPDDEAGVFSSE